MIESEGVPENLRAPLARRILARLPDEASRGRYGRLTPDGNKRAARWSPDARLLPLLREELAALDDSLPVAEWLDRYLLPTRERGGDYWWPTNAEEVAAYLRSPLCRRSPTGFFSFRGPASLRGAARDPGAPRTVSPSTAADVLAGLLGHPRVLVSVASQPRHLRDVPEGVARGGPMWEPVDAPTAQAFARRACQMSAQ